MKRSDLFDPRSAIRHLDVDVLLAEMPHEVEKDGEGTENMAFAMFWCRRGPSGVLERRERVAPMAPSGRQSSRLGSRARAVMPLAAKVAGGTPPAWA